MSPAGNASSSSWTVSGDGLTITKSGNSWSACISLNKYIAAASTNSYYFAYSIPSAGPGGIGYIFNGWLVGAPATYTFMASSDYYYQGCPGRMYMARSSGPSYGNSLQGYLFPFWATGDGLVQSGQWAYSSSDVYVVSINKTNRQWTDMKYTLSGGNYTLFTSYTASLDASVSGAPPGGSPGTFNTTQDIYPTWVVYGASSQVQLLPNFTDSNLNGYTNLLLT
jgi:hypothetical protein